MVYGINSEIPKAILYQTVVSCTTALGTVVASNFTWKYMQDQTICPSDISYIKNLQPIFETALSGVSCIQNTIRNQSAQYIYPWTIQGIFVQASVEELVCRGMIQRGLLYHVPKFFISKISPEAMQCVDSSTAKAIRIVLSSGLFALLHVANWDCTQGGTVPQLVGGIAFGALCESEGLLSSCIAHTIHNSLLQFSAIRKQGYPILF